MRGFTRAFIVAALALLAPATAFAQASITGTVKDASGAVLPGVTVEAASDVLIEKVRTTVTDGNGRFQLVDLRPGAYVVTFALPGFNTYRRDGITLAGSAAATIDADLRVGAVEETVTVTGEAPVVDVRTTTRQQVLNAEVIDALPTARNYVALARIIPGTVGGGNDVGGSLLQDVGAAVTIHGSNATDQRITLNGVSVMTLQAGGSLGGQQPDVGSAAEVTVDTSSLSAELPSGGVRINFIPRDGGNTFRNAAFFTFSNRDLQGSNISDALRTAGLPTPNRIVKNWDLNESFGGPIRRDRVWYWSSARLNRVDNETTVFANKNAFDPTKWNYEPDTSRPGRNKGEVQQGSVRLTWQASPRNKIAGTYKQDTWCQCPNNVGNTAQGLVAPEAGRDRRFPVLRQIHGEWTSPVTNQLLFEAVGMHLYERWGNMHLRVNGGSLEDPAHEAVMPQMISVLEQSTNMTYRSQAQYNNTEVPNFAYRAAVSYITGTHAIKGGFTRTHGYLDEVTYTLNPVSYRFNTLNGVLTPNQVTMRATPFRSKSNLDNDLGFYVQDRWLLNRFTINGAVRFDYFDVSFPEQTIGAAPMTPDRTITLPPLEALGWKDITYRSGATYDVRGDGKTAVKVSVNKYLLGQTLNGLARDPNPVLSLVNTANRAWNDADRDFFPDCNLLDPLPNGECQATLPSTFGSAVPGDTFDPDLLRGWGNRQYNWEFSAGAQHEVVPRVSVDLAYFRRIHGNFRVTDNVLVGPQDFTEFTMTAPTDPRLPNGGGYTLTGLFNVVPEKAGQTQNYGTLSDKIGKQIDHWNGFDVNVNARLLNGLTIQGGVSSGKRTQDDCEIVAEVPETLLTGANWRPAQYCHREEPMLTQVKLYGVYIVPKVDVQLSGSFRSVPGTDINANFVASNAYLAANSTLRRALSGGAANMTVQLLEPNSRYNERRNELDLRFGKVLRAGRHRSVLSVDLYNALNVNPIIAVNQAFASWLRPTEILNARVVKFSVQYDF